MFMKINDNTLQLIIGDITTQQTDAIVNAANGSLLGGGGVDGAIHRAAGTELLEACKRVRKNELHGTYLPTGEVAITKGYNLPAKYVIHTVGPIWDASEEVEQNILLANCYRNALQLAKERGLTSIAFPSISTGVYRFPIEKAAKIALETMSHFLNEYNFGEVVITLFSEEDLTVYENTLNELRKD